MRKSKNDQISIRFKVVLAGTKTHVRQTTGIAVRKRTRQHQQIQVKNSRFKIVLWLKEKWGAQLGAAKQIIRPVTKNERRAAQRLAQQH